MARLVATWFRGPHPRDGKVDSAGTVIGRSSHVQMTPMGVLKKWDIWSLGIKNASRQADGSAREVFAHAPCE